MQLRARTRALIARVDRQVAETSPDRDRAVDFMRVAAICVVVIWHWSLSITHRDDGRLINPNPIEQVAGGWFLTWFFQVMPVFFIVGGFANLTGWDSVVRSGHGTVEFLRRRLSRLLLPALVFVAVWAVIDIVARLSVSGYTGAFDVMPLMFTPLWFLAAYVWVTALVPVTARVHRRFGATAALVLGVVVVAVDAGRFGLGYEWLGMVNSALVWVFAHQLGYLWRDGFWQPVWRRWASAAGGVGLLAVATALDFYPRSMVSTPGDDISHMWPTTAVIAALAVFQVGLTTLVAPGVNRWLARPARYRVVVLLGGVLLTVFLWHMTALLIVFLTVEALGFTPAAEPTADWWLRRPFWLVAPAIVLVVLVAVFAPIEQRIRRALSFT